MQSQHNDNFWKSDDRDPKFLCQIKFRKQAKNKSYKTINLPQALKPKANFYFCRKK